MVDFDELYRSLEDVLTKDWETGRTSKRSTFKLKNLPISETIQKTTEGDIEAQFWMSKDRNNLNFEFASQEAFRNIREQIASSFRNYIFSNEYPKWLSKSQGSTVSHVSLSEGKDAEAEAKALVIGYYKFINEVIPGWASTILPDLLSRLKEPNVISEIAYNLNKLSHDYHIGELQDIRKKLKGLSRRAGSEIFADLSISDDWAFHYGGRKELQFNIGIEDEGLRYGIAFSLEASQSLPDISLLFPKILKFNQFLRENAGFFTHYSMWHYHNDVRSPVGPVVEISDSLLTPHTFIFIGKLTDIEDVSYENILEAFDELLRLYIYVEKEEVSNIIEYEQNVESEFVFNSKPWQLPQAREYSIEQRSVNLELRHALIQEKLISLLNERWGKDNVSAEQSVFGKRIDLVVRRSKEFDFYEIKICGSAKACIREAFGQLMEYAYWPSVENAKNLIVVGEQPIDSQSEEYLKLLCDRFNIPIRYESLTI